MGLDVLTAPENSWIAPTAIIIFVFTDWHIHHSDSLAHTQIHTHAVLSGCTISSCTAPSVVSRSVASFLGIFFLVFLPVRFFVTVV